MAPRRRLMLKLCFFAAAIIAAGPAIAGEPVSVKETQPYGYSVKYKS